MNNPKFRKLFRLLYPVLICIALLVAGVVSCSIIYTNYIQSLDESTNDAVYESLDQTYGESIQRFSALSQSRWNYLQLVGEYMEATNFQLKDRSQDLIAKMKKQYGFTEFYLINENSRYLTLDGETGIIDFGSKAEQLIEPNSNILVDGSLPGKDSMMFYAVSVDGGIYDNFAYCALAFGYNKEDISSAMTIDAFNGSSYSYVTYKSNGRVFTSIGNDVLSLSNVIETIQANMPSNSEEIIQSYKKGEKSNHIITLNSTDYYLNIQAIDDYWMLVSFTTKGAANAALVSVTEKSRTSLLAIFIIILVIIILIALYFVFRTTSRKNRLVKERELIFSQTAKYMDEVYLLYSIPNHEILYISPNCKRLIQVSEEEAYANPKCIYDRFETSLDFESVLNTSVPSNGLHLESKTKPQPDKESSSFFIDMMMPQNSKNQLIVILSDRTREEKIKEEIETSLHLAKAANNAKTTFLSAMSHDLRTPMNGILGSAELILKKKEDPEKVEKYADNIVRSGNYLLTILNDVLDMSKIESGSLESTNSEFSFSSLLKEIDTIVHPMALSKHQSFVIQSDGIPGNLVFYADKGHLLQILINLLSNAVKYTPDNGNISLSIASLDGSTSSLGKFSFEIKDNGYGMSQEFMKNMYAPFTREVTSATLQTQGTGLGLSIVRNLVTLMGGTIQAESIQNQGTTFTVNLPLILKESAKEEETKETKDNLSLLRGIHILVAEDNALNSEILKDILELNDITCDIATNGKEALTLFENSKPMTYRLILMDIQMPIMNGYEATKAIRNSSHPQAKTIPIIAMTANTFVEDIQNALASGMNAHIAKPVGEDKLFATLSQILSEEKE